MNYIFIVNASVFILIGLSIAVASLFQIKRKTPPVDAFKIKTKTPPLNKEDWHKLNEYMGKDMFVVGSTLFFTSISMIVFRNKLPEWVSGVELCPFMIILLMVAAVRYILCKRKLLRNKHL